MFAVLLVLIFLLGVAQLFVPVAEGQGSSTVNQSFWLGLAKNAWNYFQPGVGLDSVTGLHLAGLDYPYFTDWDLGVYVQATIDASKLGILSTTGTWGADERFNKTLTFLETRQLESDGVPYVWYQSGNGNPYGTGEQGATDAGALLVALNNLRVFRPDLASAVNYIVYNRTNYSPLEQQVDSVGNSRNLYDYYVASGFAAFWPSRFSNLAVSVLNNILSAPTVSTYGVQLPISDLTCEPLFSSVFNLSPSAQLQVLAGQLYLAHQARYSSTGKFAAFSEGNTGLSDPSYVYEWVVREDGSAWTVYNGQDNVGTTPIIYVKAAVGLLAMFDSSFTENMVFYLLNQLPNPSSGYSDGFDENGRLDSSTIDKTNGMIIEAALYAINQSPKPSPTPSPNPQSSPSPPVGTVTPSPSPSHTLVPSSSAAPTSSSSSATSNPSSSPVSTGSSQSPGPSSTASSSQVPASVSSTSITGPSQSPFSLSSTNPSSSPNSLGSPTSSASPGASMSPSQSGSPGSTGETLLFDSLAVVAVLVFFTLLAVGLRRRNSR